MSARLARHLLAPIFFFLLAYLQLFVFVNPLDELAGHSPSFLYGRDTVTHDAVVQIYFQDLFQQFPGQLPLWSADFHSGVPTIGALLYTPFHYSTLLFYGLEFPHAQRFSLLLALWIASLGGYYWARAIRLDFLPAIFCGVICGLCGHLVTLIHAGHFLKIMALAWVPLLMAGVELLLRNTAQTRLLSVGLIAFALGMMNLSGHPQISYMALLMVFLRVVAAERFREVLLPLFIALSIGVLLSMPMVLPVLEFSPHSNRADGVSYEEAVLTSYPPGEITEYIIPRVKGSNVFGDVYTGGWGERIVSDYIGKATLLLVLFSLLFFRQNCRLKIVYTSIAILFLLIGLGSNTPLYRVFYTILPGFASFRSPGTFMAATSFAFAILAAMGLQQLLVLCRERFSYRPALAVGAVIIALQAGDLLIANRHFLFIQSFDRYRVDFLQPTDLDEYLAANGLNRSVHDELSPLSLRPILFGRQARNGYHPVYFKAKEGMDEYFGFQSVAWYEFFAVNHVLLPSNIELPEEYIGRERRFPERTLLRIDDRVAPAFERLPSGFQLEIPQRVEALNPGLIIFGHWMINGEKQHYRSAGFINYSEYLPVAAGDIPVLYEYQPRSYRIGVYLGTIGLLLLSGIITVAARNGIARR